MRELKDLCLTPVRPLKPKEIRALRLWESASQAVFAHDLTETIRSGRRLMRSQRRDDLNRRTLLNRRRLGQMDLSAQAQEQCQTLIEGDDLLPRQLSEHAPDPPLVKRSQMVDQRE